MELEVVADIYIYIYISTPTVKADYWINVRAEPPLNAKGHFSPNASDFVAKVGGQWNIFGGTKIFKWIIPNGPAINATVFVHHADAGDISRAPIKGQASALDYLFAFVKLRLS